MTPELSTLLAIVAGGLVLLAGGVYWWTNRSPHIERGENEPLPLFGSTSREQWSNSASVRTPRLPGKPTVEPGTIVPRLATEPVSGSLSAPPRPKPVIREFDTGTSSLSTPRNTSAASPSAAAPTPGSAPVAHEVVSETGVPGTMVEGHALRFSVPAEGTLQFLPGRLEIGSGLDGGREIRFVRLEGPNGIEVTFGRSEGELYRHVQLRDKTVSRSHGIMRFADGVWWLQNLSLTNPVVYNGAQMPAGVAQPLADGDRIEMGEVLFTYRGR